MATQYNLIAEIKASEKIIDRLNLWAEKELPEDDQCRIVEIDPEADYTWMGLIPAILDESLNKETFPTLASYSFCNGSSIEENTVSLYYYGVIDERLWRYIGDKHPEIEKIRIYVDPDYDFDITELGEDDLFVYKR